MWFLLLGIALAVVAAGGLYVRRRVMGSLEVFGVRRRLRRGVGLALLWLLFGFPALVFGSILAALALKRASLFTAPTGIAEWLLVYPYWMTVLVVLQSVPYLALFDLAYLAGRKRFGRQRCLRYRAIGCFAVIAVFAIYMPARILIERGEVRVKHYQIGESGEPLRIVFFADLQRDHHIDEDRSSRVMSLINEQEPDLILVGGDWINTGPDYIEEAARSAAALRSRLGIVSVSGDHEHFAYRDRERSVREVSRALKRHGVDMVDNEVRWIEHRGKRIAVICLSYNYIYKSRNSEIRELIARTRGADYSILLTHQLDKELADLIAGSVDLALVAHTHGGQVNPVVGFVHVPLARVETPYIAGRYQLGSTTLIVTSGIGYSIAPFRYASPGSIEVIDLRLAR